MDEQASSHKEVAVTYETLYELLRREKLRDELQTLDNGFLLDVLGYLRDKQRILDEAEQKQDLFSLDEREKTQVQLVNIRKIVRELYERREKKIIEMALNRSRTKSNLIDTATLLAHERYLFDSVVSVLDSFRATVLHNVLSLREPSLSVDLPAPASPSNGMASSANAPVSAVAAAAAIDAAKLARSQEEPAATVKRVKFTQPVEQFVGEELELYGPFQPEQKEQLPAHIADILIEKGSAVEVEAE